MGKTLESRMRLLLVAGVVAALLATCVWGVSGSGPLTIEGRVLHKGLKNAKVVLSGPEVQTSSGVNAAGEFGFRIPTPGEERVSYRVDVVAMEAVFPSVHVRVDPRKPQTPIKAYAANDTSVRYAYPLVLRPLSVSPPSPAILSMLLGNPMILMMVVMGGLSMLMPMLVESLPEEDKAELQNSALAKSQVQAQNMDFIGSLSSMAASLTTEDEAPSTKKK